MSQVITEEQAIKVLEIADLDTDRTSDYVSVKNYKRVKVYFYTGVGTAGDDWNFTMRQATAVAGTGVKDLDVIDTYGIKQAATDLTGTGTFTKTTQTKDALISGNGTSAEEATFVQFEFSTDELDVENGFDCIACTVTLDASGGAQNGDVTFVLCDPRYPQETALEALTD